jgi:hypothetical protein
LLDILLSSAISNRVLQLTKIQKNLNQIAAATRWWFDSQNKSLTKEEQKMLYAATRPRRTNSLAIRRKMSTRHISLPSLIQTNDGATPFDGRNPMESLYLLLKQDVHRGTGNVGLSSNEIEALADAFRFVLLRGPLVNRFHPRLANLNPLGDSGLTNLMKQATLSIQTSEIDDLYGQTTLHLLRQVLNHAQPSQSMWPLLFVFVCWVVLFYIGLNVILLLCGFFILQVIKSQVC